MSLNAAGLAPLNQSYGVINMATGNYTGDGSGSIQVFVGFTPRMVKVYDITDVTTWEWVDGMPSTNTVKTVTGGTVTVDTNSLIVTNGTSYSITENSAEEGSTPGTGAAGDGQTSDITITAEYPTLGTAQLTFGSGLNTSAKVYAFVAMG